MNRILYHYTTIEALTKMLHVPDETEKHFIEVNKESGYGYYLSFHATDAYMMNDRMEHKLILDIVDQIIPENLKSIYDTEIASVGRPYIVSFCSERDYIPMWRGYAQNNVGVCLQFDLSEDNIDVLKTVNADREIFRDYICFGKCKYRKASSLTAKLRTLIGDIEKEYQSLPDGQISKNYPFLKLHKEAILYKGSEWSYEKEWRLSWWSNHNKTKSGKYGIAPYQDVKIPLRFLKEILIAPSNDQDLVQYGLQQWIKENGLHRLKAYDIDIKVSPSELSIR